MNSSNQAIILTADRRENLNICIYQRQKKKKKRGYLFCDSHYLYYEITQNITLKRDDPARMSGTLFNQNLLLLCIKNSVRCFLYVILTKSGKNSASVISILQMRKWRISGVKLLTQRHTAETQQRVTLGPYTTIPVLFLLQQNCLFCSMCWLLLDCPLFCNLAFIYFSGISNLLIPSLMHLFTTGHSHFTLFPTTQNTQPPWELNLNNIRGQTPGWFAKS